MTEATARTSCLQEQQHYYAIN